MRCRGWCLCHEQSLWMTRTQGWVHGALIQGHRALDRGFGFPWSDCLFASCQPVLLVLSVYLQHLVLISMGCCSKNQCGLGAQTKTRTAHSSGGCKGDSVAGISARAIFLVLQKTAFLRCLYLEERGKGVGEAHLQPVASLVFWNTLPPSIFLLAELLDEQICFKYV